MDQKQKEKELKALRKLREAVEEGQIGKALVLVTRIIQEKALADPTHLTDGKAMAAYDKRFPPNREIREGDKEREEKNPYAKTPAVQRADFEAQEEAHAELASQVEAAKRMQERIEEEKEAANNLPLREGEKEQDDES